MCGRGACGLDPNALKRVCNVDQFLNSDKYFPSYNICPNNFIPVLLAQEAMLKYYRQSVQTQETKDIKTESKTDDDNTHHQQQQQRILSTMRWGLVPSFSKDGKTTNAFRTINARQDTIKSKPMYRRLVNSKRCIVLFNGYYEWQTTKKNAKHKQPYYFTPQYTQNQDDTQKTETETEEAPLMYMAALWDCWRDPNDPQNKLFTVTILTTDSNDDVSFCHHRMPLIMTKECVDKWLNTERYTIDECFKDIAESQKFIKITNHAVPREIVGNTRTKGIECIQTLKEYEAKKRKTGLHKFFATAKPTKKEKEKKEKKVEVETVTNDDNTDNRNISDDVEDKELEQAIKASLEESGQDKKDEMKVDTDNEEDREPMDEDLRKAIEASMESYTKEEKKRRKKRRLEEVEELEDLDELQISEENPVKKRKLNSGSAKKQSTKRKGKTSKK